MRLYRLGKRQEEWSWLLLTYQKHALSLPKGDTREARKRLILIWLL